MGSEIVWKTLSEEDRKRQNFEKLWGETSSHQNPVVSVPHNVLMPKEFASIADRILNFEVRPDDIWIITYPKCGTTWTQEIVWNIMNDVDKELGKLPLFARSPFLEMQGLHPPEKSPSNKFSQDSKHGDMIKRIFDESVDSAANQPSPRIIKTHLPFELLPQNLLDTAKVIYVCRNPKDTCVSYYHHHTDVLGAVYEFKGTFDQFADSFMAGILQYGSYFDHLKSAWKHRKHPNMKFVWYEDMKKNTIKEVTDMTKFVNHPLSESKVIELVEHLKFNNMKERAVKVMADESFIKFFRKGTVGDWKNYFTGERLKAWDDWIANNLEGSDIEFNFG